MSNTFIIHNTIVYSKFSMITMIRLLFLFECACLKLWFSLYAIHQDVLGN